MDRLQKIAIASLGVSIVVLAVKYAAYLLTGSVALYSDALESVVNVVSATTALIAIRIAAMPPDAGHPYGHHKAEYLSAVVVGALILVAAIAILREAYNGFLDPQPLDAPGRGLLVSGAATALNLAWALVLMREGRRSKSAALTADGQHVLVDVVTTAGVLVGVGLVVATGILWLDSAIAALVALNVLWSGFGVLRANASGLMDESVKPDELQRIRAAISLSGGGSIEAHDLRTRHAGRATFVDFHLVVPRSMTVAEAHAICDQLEAAIEREIEGAVVTIHVEPEEEAKQTGIPVLVG